MKNNGSKQTIDTPKQAEEVRLAPRDKQNAKHRHNRAFDDDPRKPAEGFGTLATTFPCKLNCIVESRKKFLFPLGAILCNRPGAIHALCMIGEARALATANGEVVQHRFGICSCVGHGLSSLALLLRQRPSHMDFALSRQHA